MSSKYKKFKGVSPSLIVSKAGVSQQTLYRWAKGGGRSRPYTSKKIESAINYYTSDEFKEMEADEVSTRRLVDFSADKIAAGAGVSRATVFNWFNGGGRMSHEKITMAIKALKNEIKNADHGCKQELELEGSVSNTVERSLA